LFSANLDTYDSTLRFKVDQFIIYYERNIGSGSITRNIGSIKLCAIFNNAIDAYTMNELGFKHKTMIYSQRFKKEKKKTKNGKLSEQENKSYRNQLQNLDNFKSTCN